MCVVFKVPFNPTYNQLLHSSEEFQSSNQPWNLRLFLKTRFLNIVITSLHLSPRWGLSTRGFGVAIYLRRTADNRLPQSVTRLFKKRNLREVYLPHRWCFQTLVGSLSEHFRTHYSLV